MAGRAEFLDEKGGNLSEKEVLKTKTPFPEKEKRLGKSGNNSRYPNLMFPDFRERVGTCPPG